MARAAAPVTLVLLVLAGLTGLAVWLLSPAGTAPAAAPSAPSSAASTVTASAGIPTRVEIPAIGVDSSLVGVGLLDDGQIQTPDFGLAAWYDLGPRPGDPGPAVVLAHVDSKAGPDVFYRLRELGKGDRVTVHSDSGSATFEVESSEQVPKEHLPTERIWNDTDDPVLRLITCGGEFNRAIGSYRDNIIVYASLVGDGPGD